MRTSPERAGVSIAWRPAERFAFRAAFTYFALFFLASLFDVGPGPRGLLSAMHSPLVRWLGERVMDCVATLTTPVCRGPSRVSSLRCSRRWRSRSCGRS